MRSKDDLNYLQTMKGYNAHKQKSSRRRQREFLVIVEAASLMQLHMNK